MVASDLKIQNVSVRYGLKDREVIALDDVSLDIEDGHTVSLVGPSGCGKTTLLNIVAGFATPTAGVVTVNGKPVTGPSADRAVVFQTDAVFPWLSVRKNLEYGPKVLKKSDAETRERVDRYLEIMGLTAFERDYPKVLSGGMRKRVDVARAYVNDPAVVLLDEPFGALDDFTKSHLQDELVRLRTFEPKTTIFVTHDIEEAIYVADTVVVMSARPGRVLEVINVPFPTQRTSAIKDLDEFHELRLRIQRLLRQALSKALEEEEAGI